jgi:hypothetical protein
VQVSQLKLLLKTKNTKHKCVYADLALQGPAIRAFESIEQAQLRTGEWLVSYNIELSYNIERSRESFGWCRGTRTAWATTDGKL